MGKSVYTINPDHAARGTSGRAGTCLPQLKLPPYRSLRKKLYPILLVGSLSMYARRNGRTDS